MQKYLIISLISLTLFGFGCRQKAENKAIETVLNAQLGTEGKVDIDENELRFTGEDGGSMVYGTNVSLPKDFPTDIPIYKNGRIISATITQSGSAVSISSTDTPDIILAWHEQELSTYKKTADVSFGVSSMRTFEKDGVQIAVNVATLENKSMVTVTRTPMQGGN